MNTDISAKKCSTCCSRYICMMKGTPCAGHDDRAMFIQMLYCLEPNINWEEKLEVFEE